MEIFQTLQWLYGDVNDYSITGTSYCDIVNTRYTIIAHLLIWLQPILFSYIGYRTNKNNNFFKYYNYLTIIVLIYSLMLLYMGINHEYYYSINDSIF